MELKTLKDLKDSLETTSLFNKKRHKYISVEEIKQEAIKRVKFMNTQQGEGGYTDEFIEGYTQGLIEFHNITEEDLKWLIHIFYFF